MVREGGRGVPERARCRVEVARLAEQEPEPLQRAGGDAVARGHGFVTERLRPVNQRLVIVGGEPEAAVLRVVEMLEQRVRELDRETEPRAVPPRLEQLEQRV